MQKSRSFALAAFAFLALCLVISSVSAASIWEPRYESYRLSTDSYGHSSGSYSSTSTYEKVTTENEDRFGSDNTTVIRKSETETFVPAARTEVRHVFSRDDDYSSPRYNSHSFGYAYDYPRQDVNYGNVYIHYTDSGWKPSSNWRFKEVYHDYDYPNENSYGYDYYYAPRYDWHRGVYNWRY